MKLWLRLALITMTVGGGFEGFVLTFQALQSGIASHSQAPSNLLVMVIFLLLNGGVTASGLLFVCNPDRTNPLMAALAIQVPWISSYVIAYRFATGLEVVLNVKGPAGGEGFALHLGANLFLGATWSLTLLQEHQFGVGVNVWALTMLVLLWRSVRTPLAMVDPTIPASTDGSQAAHL